MNEILDAHYFMLPNQGNIYSLAVLNLCSGINKFIVASLKKKIFSFEYCGTLNGSLTPTVKEISCTYIPSGAEIISVDAFNKSKTCDDFQIGIAIVKSNVDGSPETYLNIYSEQDLVSNYILNIDSVAQNCLMVELTFIPYHLTHSCLIINDMKQIVWLLSGSDGNIHVFQEDEQNHSYIEGDMLELFPELANPPSIVMWLQIQYTYQFTRRISVIGCECGTVQLFVVNIKSNSVISTHSDVFDGPISQVMLFSLTPQNIHPPPSEETKSVSSSNSPKSDLHLLVCNTLQASVVYMNVEETGFSEKHMLEGSELYDACLCACAADMNMDGFNEILLGTYGQELLMYKWKVGEWVLGGQRSTANPVHAIHYMDLMGDGVDELVVQTLSGVHIMQHKPEEVLNIFLTRMKNLCNKKGIQEFNTIKEAEDCSSTEA